VINRDQFSMSSGRADKVRGVHVAIVTDNKDQPSPFLIKVKYPWLPGDDKTYWARVAMPMAGPERGAYFLPEVDDQVLVVFVHGDIEQPVIIGSLWNQKQPPPEANADGKNDVKVLKSKSGHRIVFDDTAGDEKVTVVDSTKKNKIAMSVKDKITTIESSGNITIKAQGNVLIHGNTVKMTAKGKIEGTGKSRLAISTDGAINVKASSKMTVSGSTCNIQMGAGKGEGGAGGAAGGGQQGSAAVAQVTGQIGRAHV